MDKRAVVAEKLCDVTADLVLEQHGRAVLEASAEWATANKLNEEEIIEMNIRGLLHNEWPFRREHEVTVTFRVVTPSRHEARGEVNRLLTAAWTDARAVKGWQVLE